MKSSGFADYPWIQSFIVSFLSGLTLYLVRNANVGPDGSFVISFDIVEIILVIIIGLLIFGLLGIGLIRDGEASNENLEVREEEFHRARAAQMMNELDEREKRMNELHDELLGDDDDSPREEN